MDGGSSRPPDGFTLDALHGQKNGPTMKRIEFSYYTMFALLHPSQWPLSIQLSTENSARFILINAS
jgi:hypothetical protein